MNWAMAAEQAAGRSESGYWQLALILGAIGFLGLFARWRKMRSPLPPSVKELRDRDENPNRYRDVADRAIVELLETSRTLNAQVDTKIRMLNRLVKEAEEHCTRLERLLAKAEGVEIEADALRASASAKAGVVPAYQSGRVAAVDATKEEAKQEPKFLSDLHERVYRLQHAGKTVAEIARATNLSTTEVEFILKTF